MEKTNSGCIKIAIVGPESSGKTTLCSQLANYFNGAIVPEFARQYLSNLNRPYTLQDVLFIANEQLHLEQKIEQQGNKIIFCDTNLITIKIWLKVKYNYFNAQLEHNMLQNFYHAHFLTAPDLPWENDILREHPYFRNELLNMHEDILNLNNIKFSLIDGIGEGRINKAIEEVKKII